MAVEQRGYHAAIDDLREGLVLSRQLQPRLQAVRDPEALQAQPVLRSRPWKTLAGHVVYMMCIFNMSEHAQTLTLAGDATMLHILACCKTSARQRGAACTGMRHHIRLHPTASPAAALRCVGGLHGDLLIALQVHLRLGVGGVQPEGKVDGSKRPLSDR